MKFTKMHGTGNDFLMVETRDDSRDWESVAAAMCDRHFGVGADGVMLVMPSAKADVRMRLPWTFSTFDYRELCGLLWEQCGDARFDTAKVDGVCIAERAM